MARRRRQGRPASSPGSTRPSSSTPRPEASWSTRPGCATDRQAQGRAGRPLRARLVLRRRELHRPGRRPAPGRVHGAEHRPGCACTAPPRCRPAERVRRRGSAPVCSPAPAVPLRPAHLRQPQGPPGPPHRGGQGALLGAGQPDRPPGRGPGRPASWCGSSTGASWSRPIPARPRAGAPPTRRTCRRKRPSTPCGTSTACRPWPPPTARPSAPTPRCMLGRPAAVDQDAPGLRAAWAWSRSGGPSGSRPPAPGRPRPRRSTSALIGRMLERGHRGQRRRAAAPAVAPARPLRPPARALRLPSKTGDPDTGQTS